MSRTATLVIAIGLAATCATGCASSAPTARIGSPALVKPTFSEVFRETVSTEVNRVTLWDHYVAWATGPRYITNQLVVVDRRSGEHRVVARARAGDGQTDWIRGSGDFVVYTDQDRQQSDEQPATPWRLIVQDLITGQTSVVSASRNSVSEEFVPLPMIEAPWVVWGEITPSGEPVVLTYNISTRQHHTLLSGVDAGWITVSDGQVVYDASSSSAHRDVFAMPVDGSSKPRQITTSGDVTHPVAANGHITWQEPKQNDPQSIWEASLHGTPSPKKVEARQNFGNAVPGQSFVAWYGSPSGAIFVRVNGSPAIRLSQGPPSVAARLDAAEDEVVWAEYPNSDPDEITTVVIIKRLNHRSPR